MTASARKEPTDHTTERIENALDVLGDKYARRILEALDVEPMPAVELADTCDMSRTTVYRRLDRLETLGFVTSRFTYDPDGHHRKQFHLVLDEIRIGVDEDGFGGDVSIGTAAGD